mmetsp:Transcript_42505/g.120629  ORF Transcript_42505/g.120629 Transcript_42505/m.120629 type:complete len:102 (-) Transcript_42505:330-635(-)
MSSDTFTKQSNTHIRSRTCMHTARATNTPFSRHSIFIKQLHQHKLTNSTQKAPVSGAGMPVPRIWRKWLKRDVSQLRGTTLCSLQHHTHERRDTPHHSPSH